jgi:predicted DNA-binding transcriptional regulator YafY
MPAEQIQRQWNLLIRLQTRGEGFPLKELAEEFGVSERTIQRDLETLRDLEFPIEHDDNEFGKRYWRLQHDFIRSGPLMLSFSEAVSLHLAERLFVPLTGTHLAEGLHSTLAKIRKILPRKALDYFGSLEDTIYVRQIGSTALGDHDQVIQALLDGARDRRCVQIAYRALWRGEEYTTRCDPYGLVFFEGELYLVAKSHRADAIRIFKVTRIARAESSPERFERPEDFALEDQFKTSFGIIHSEGPLMTIQVKFSGTAANLIEERMFHESQRIAWLPPEETLFDPELGEPETLVATFRLSNTVEFKRWIKGFGDRAEVLNPDWLRAEIREELEAAARVYDA